MAAVAVVEAAAAEPQTLALVQLRALVRQVDASPLEAGAAGAEAELDSCLTHIQIPLIRAEARTAYSSSDSRSRAALAAPMTAAAPPAPAAVPHLLADDTGGTARETTGAAAVRLVASSSSARFFASA